MSKKTTQKSEVTEESKYDEVVEKLKEALKNSYEKNTDQRLKDLRKDDLPARDSAVGNAANKRADDPKIDLIDKWIDRIYYSEIGTYEEEIQLSMGFWRIYARSFEGETFGGVDEKLEEAKRRYENEKVLQGPLEFKLEDFKDSLLIDPAARCDYDPTKDEHKHDREQFLQRAIHPFDLPLMQYLLRAVVIDQVKKSDVEKNQDEIISQFDKFLAQELDSEFPLVDIAEMKTGINSDDPPTLAEYVYGFIQVQENVPIRNDLRKASFALPESVVPGTSEIGQLKLLWLLANPGYSDGISQHTDVFNHFTDANLITDGKFGVIENDKIGVLQDQFYIAKSMLSEEIRQEYLPWNVRPSYFKHDENSKDKHDENSKDKHDENSKDKHDENSKDKLVQNWYYSNLRGSVDSLETGDSVFSKSIEQNGEIPTAFRVDASQILRIECFCYRSKDKTSFENMIKVFANFAPIPSCMIALRVLASIIKNREDISVSIRSEANWNTGLKILEDHLNNPRKIPAGYREALKNITSARINSNNAFAMGEVNITNWISQLKVSISDSTSTDPKPTKVGEFKAPGEYLGTETRPPHAAIAKKSTGELSDKNAASEILGFSDAFAPHKHLNALFNEMIGYTLVNQDDKNIVLKEVVKSCNAKITELRTGIKNVDSDNFQKIKTDELESAISFFDHADTDSSVDELSLGELNERFEEIVKNSATLIWCTRELDWSDGRKNFREFVNGIAIAMRKTALNIVYANLGKIAEYKKRQERNRE